MSFPTLTFSLVYILLALFPNFVVAQGSIMLVGGGAENRNAWSDIPYQWAINQSNNKKVAIISYDPGGDPDWLPNYFNDLGASAATNFVVDSQDKANLQSLVDEIKNHDVFFLKGGDQSRYYEYYKNTLLEEAIEAKFSEGGVIAGTSAGAAIIAGIAFTAENGTLYPDQAISDVFHERLILKNDFLSILPGTIVDTHFIERGRQARLMAMMAHWYAKNDTVPLGIGVDDRTTLCIDQQGVATAYGSGSVSIYSSQYFATTDDILIADSIHSIQLLHENKINLRDLQLINPPGELITIAEDQENGNYTVFLTGDEQVNTEFIEAFAAEGNYDQDTVIIVSRANSSIAQSYAAQIKATSQHVSVSLIHTSPNYNDPDSASVRNFIRNSHKVLFVDNDDGQLLDFLENGPTGILLKGHLFRNGMIIGFIGEDSNLAGKYFCTNIYQNELNAYNGQLQFEKGIGLLTNSMTMADTYSAGTTDYYENKVSAVLYQLVEDTLAFGIYLNRDSYCKFSQSNGENVFSADGDYPTWIVINQDGHAGLNERPNRSGDIRMVVGTTNIQHTFIHDSLVLPAGMPIPSQDFEYDFEPVPTSIPADSNLAPKIFQPDHSKIEIHWPGQGYQCRIFDLNGQLIIDRKYFHQNQILIDSLKSGIYVLMVNNLQRTLPIQSHKFIKQ